MNDKKNTNYITNTHLFRSQSVSSPPLPHFHFLQTPPEAFVRFFGAPKECLFFLLIPFHRDTEYICLSIYSAVYSRWTGTRRSSIRKQPYHPHQLPTHSPFHSASQPASQPRNGILFFRSAESGDAPQCCYSVSDSGSAAAAALVPPFTSSFSPPTPILCAPFLTQHLNRISQHNVHATLGREWSWWMRARRHTMDKCRIVGLASPNPIPPPPPSTTTTRIVDAIQYIIINTGRSSVSERKTPVDMKGIKRDVCPTIQGNGSVRCTVVVSAGHEMR